MRCLPGSSPSTQLARNSFDFRVPELTDGACEALSVIEEVFDGGLLLGIIVAPAAAFGLGPRFPRKASAQEVTDAVNVSRAVLYK